MTFPAELDVIITSRHLDTAARKGTSVLGLAVRDALDKTGIPYRDVKVTDNSVLVYQPRRISHSARYWIPDDAWKINARSATGRMVKPGIVTLRAAYLDSMVALPERDRKFRREN